MVLLQEAGRLAPLFLRPAPGDLAHTLVCLLACGGRACPGLDPGLGRGLASLTSPPVCGQTAARTGGGSRVIIEWHTHVYPPEEAAADARTFDGKSGPTWGGRCPMTV